MTSILPLAAYLAGIPGGIEIYVILIIVLILFGRRLPGVARSLGQGISSFKKGLNEPLDEEEKKQEPKNEAPDAEPSKTTKKIEETSDS